MIKPSIVAAVYTFFIAATTYNIAKQPPTRPPNQFFYSNKKAKGIDEILNMRQILLIQPAWSPRIPQNKQTKKNADWTAIKLTDGSVHILEEKMSDVLNRMRTYQ